MTRPARSLRILSVILALAVFVSAHTGSAATVREPAVDFTMSLALPGAVVCMILPAPEQADTRCAGIDAAAIARAMRSAQPSLTNFAMIAYPRWRFSVTVVAQPGTSLRTEEDITRYIESIKLGVGQNGAEATARGRSTGTAYDIESVNGARAIRTEIDLGGPSQAGRGAPSHMIVYALVGKNGLAQVVFASDAPHTADLDRAAEAIIATASIPTARIEDFGEKQSYIHAKRIGPLVLVVAVAAIVAALLTRARRRRER